MLSTWWTPLRGKYDDGGFSCGNTDRPALQRLLEGCAGRLKRPQTEQQYYPELTGIRSLTERCCRQFRALRSPRDPAPSALWLDGASVVRRDAAINRTEDLNVEVCEATNSCITRSACIDRKPCAIGRWQF